MRLETAIITGVLAISVASAAHAVQDSAPPIAPAPVGLTRGQAMAWFYLDVARCLFGLEHGVGVAELPAEVRGDLRLALPPERFLYKDPAIKVWTNDLYGSHVVLAERTADRCEVVAGQLPVEATFQQVRDRLHSADPTLVEVPVKGGYNPIAYQFERTAGGYRYVVHLEGSEPGGLEHPGRMLMGHAYRFSLLNAFVVRQPEAAKPMFR